MSAINSKMLITLIIEFLVFSLVFFLAAGTVFWFYGWIFLILLGIFSFVTVLWLLRHNPGLIKERMTGFKPDEPTWDKAYMILTGILVGIWWISMPLDAVRFHWSQMPTWLHIVGAIVVSCSFYLWYLTFRENPYLSTAVRIQEDRGQTAVSTGPYRYVRHPMYTGGLLFFCRIGFLAGIVDRSATRAPLRGHTCKAGGAGGMRVTDGTQRV